jgi:hypothetical protein
MNLPFVRREATDRLIREIPLNLERYRAGQTAQLIQASDCGASRIEVGEPPPLTVREAIPS